MDVLRVFNNNVVLAKDGDREVILTGRGIGFQAKPGQHVDDAKIVRRFVPADGRDPDHMAELLAGIPPEIIRLVTDAMSRTGLAEQIEAQPTLVMALADHICGAIQRSQKGQTIEYPLEAEVRSLYAGEYAKGEALVNAMNDYLGGALPKGEAVALALHLVNAGFSTGDLSNTYTMTGVIQQMLSVIENTYDVTLDQHSVNVGRFITHLRYLFVRIYQHQHGIISAGDRLREATRHRGRHAVERDADGSGNRLSGASHFPRHSRCGQGIVIRGDDFRHAYA